MNSKSHIPLAILTALFLHIAVISAIVAGGQILAKTGSSEDKLSPAPITPAPLLDIPHIDSRPQQVFSTPAMAPPLRDFRAPENSFGYKEKPSEEKPPAAKKRAFSPTVPQSKPKADPTAVPRPMIKPIPKSSPKAIPAVYRPINSV